MGAKLLQDVRQDLADVVQVCEGKKKQTNYLRTLINELVKGAGPPLREHSVGWPGPQPRCRRGVSCSAGALASEQARKFLKGFLFLLCWLIEHLLKSLCHFCSLGGIRTEKRWVT